MDTETRTAQMILSVPAMINNRKKFEIKEESKMLKLDLYTSKFFGRLEHPQKATSTQLPFNNTKTEYFVENGTVYITNLLQNATMYIYDCTGKMIDITTSNHYTLPSKGLYHIIIIENDRKIDNFDVIY